MQDEALLRVIAEIPQQPQRQYGTDEQLRVLQAAANKLGLYDAADVIRNWFEATERVNRAFENDKKRAHLYDANGRRK